MRPNLVTFIKENFNEDNIFWPHLSKTNYSQVTNRYLESENLIGVKNDNFSLLYLPNYIYSAALAKFLTKYEG